MFCVVRRWRWCQFSLCLGTCVKLAFSSWILPMGALQISGRRREAWDSAVLALTSRSSPVLFPYVTCLVLTASLQGKSGSPLIGEETGAQNTKHLPLAAWLITVGLSLEPENPLPFYPASPSLNPARGLPGAPRYLSAWPGRSVPGSPSRKGQLRPDWEGQHILCRASKQQARSEPGVGFTLRFWFPRGCGGCLRGAFGFGFQISS